MNFIGPRLAVLACIVPSGPFVNKMLLHAWIFHALCAHRAHWRHTSTRSHADVNQRLTHTQHRTQSACELPCFPNALIKRRAYHAELCHVFSLRSYLLKIVFLIAGWKKMGWSAFVCLCVTVRDWCAGNICNFQFSYVLLPIIMEECESEAN